MLLQFLERLVNTVQKDAPSATPQITYTLQKKNEPNKYFNTWDREKAWKSAPSRKPFSIKHNAKCVYKGRGKQKE